MSESDRQGDPWASVPRQGGGAPPAGPGPGYGYPPPGAPYYYQQYPVRKTNGLAIASLVCGICGCIYLVPAILGIVFGCISLRQIRRDGTDGRGMALAGIITGTAWLALTAIVVLVVIAASN